MSVDWTAVPNLVRGRTKEAGMFVTVVVDCFLMALSGHVWGAEFTVSDVKELAAALRMAQTSDSVVLKKGVYKARITLNKPGLILRGEEGAVIDAAGDGIALKIRKPKIRVNNLTIRNYGKNLKARHAGIRVYKNANDVTLSELVLEGPGFGIRADDVERLRIENCSITGDTSLYEVDRGDGVFLRRVKDPILTGNSVRNVRDGFYLEYVERSKITRNAFDGTVYSCHFMYTKGDYCGYNTAKNARGAWTLMDSEGITLEYCTSSSSQIFGILLNVMDKCDVHDNVVSLVHNPQGRAVSDTEGKGIFVYGPGTNKIYRNHISQCDIGIGVAMGGEGNVLWDNAFVDNRIQVRYVGEKPLEWSHEGRGNYWSTYMGWDLNHDGIGDRSFQPNDSLDRIFWIYPEASFLMDSPVVALLRWITSQFEMDRGKGVTDSHPLISVPPLLHGRNN